MSARMSGRQGVTLSSRLAAIVALLMPGGDGRAGGRRAGGRRRDRGAGRGPGGRGERDALGGTDQPGRLADSWQRRRRRWRQPGCSSCSRPTGRGCSCSSRCSRCSPLFGLAARYALGATGPAAARAARRERSRAAPPPSGVLIINLKSGGGKAERFDLVGEARRRGIEPVVLEPGDDLLALAEDAVDAGRRRDRHGRRRRLPGAGRDGGRPARRRPRVHPGGHAQPLRARPRPRPRRRRRRARRVLGRASSGASTSRV